MMKSKQAQFVLLIVGVIIIVVGLGFAANKAEGPSKYDDFAKALKSSGTEFFGAFWCPHCQAQKAEFGKASQYIPYIECSKPDQSPTQICIDNKIEGFPTWRFKNGITLKSNSTPIICEIKPGAKDQPAVCENAGSQYTKAWVFPEYKFSIKSPVDPIKTGDVWKFVPESKATGEIPLTFLAEQIGFTLPQ